MKTLILTPHQAKLILQNILPDKSITGRNDHLQRILSDKPIKPNKKH
jgi:hypothetical protein